MAIGELLPRWSGQDNGVERSKTELDVSHWEQQHGLGWEKC